MNWQTQILQNSTLGAGIFDKESVEGPTGPQPTEHQPAGSQANIADVVTLNDSAEAQALTGQVLTSENSLVKYVRIQNELLTMLPLLHTGLLLLKRSENISLCKQYPPVEDKTRIRIALRDEELLNELVKTFKNTSCTAVLKAALHHVLASPAYGRKAGADIPGWLKNSTGSQSHVLQHVNIGANPVVFANRNGQEAALSGDNINLPFYVSSDPDVFDPNLPIEFPSTARQLFLQQSEDVLKQHKGQLQTAMSEAANEDMILLLCNTLEVLEKCLRI